MRKQLKYHLLLPFPALAPPFAPPLNPFDPPFEPPFPFDAFWISLVLNLFSKAFVLLFLRLSPPPLFPPSLVSFHPCLNFLLWIQFYFAIMVFL
jgi:hypothetical protein